MWDKHSRQGTYLIHVNNFIIPKRSWYLQLFQNLICVSRRILDLTQLVFRRVIPFNPAILTYLLLFVYNLQGKTSAHLQFEGSRRNTVYHLNIPFKGHPCSITLGRTHFFRLQMNGTPKLEFDSHFLQG